MALTRPEQAIIEALKNMLDDDALGVTAHKKADTERAHMFTFLHEEIEQAYRLLTIDLNHHDDVCSAFSKIHSHKYLNDPNFIATFEKELNARGVPLEEQTAAIKAIDKVTKNLLADSKEKDAGWNPDLDQIIIASQPPQVAESIDKRTFFHNSKVREWVSGDIECQKLIRENAAPDLAELGYAADSIDEFWAIYDDDAAEFAIRSKMNMLFENLCPKYKSYVEA